MTKPPILDRRALNRATLARQGLLERWRMPAESAIERLVGLQAQTPQTWYVGLWSRIEDFRPEEVSDLLVGRRIVRIALMRSTIHLVTAADAGGLRRLVQPVHDRMFQGQFGRRVAGLEMSDIASVGRAFVEVEPRTFRALGDHLLEHWPDRDRLALEMAVRTGVPLVQVPPRGLWGRSGQIAHTSIEAWLGPTEMPPMSLDDMVRRYLAAFGPASVMDVQAWCGLTRLREVTDRLRPELAVFRDEQGRELFDLPDAPRPGPDVPAPPRFLYDYENLLLSYADRSRALPPRLMDRIGPRTNESISTFLLDGSVAGTWKLERGRGRATLVVAPLVPVSVRDRVAIESEGERLLAFLASDTTDRDLRLLPAALAGGHPHPG